MSDKKVEMVKVKVPFENENASWEDPIMASDVRVKGFLSIYSKKFFILTKGGELFQFKNDTSKKPLEKKPVCVCEMYVRFTDTKRNTIKVERYPAHLYFQLESSTMADKWMKMLVVAGGIEKEMEVTKKQKRSKTWKKETKKESEPEIAVKDLKQWNRGNVLHWLQVNSFGKEEFTIYSENFAKKKGTDLEKLEEKDLFMMGITNLPHRKKIMRALKSIRITRTFNYKEYCVYTKIEQMAKCFGKLRNANWKYIAKTLSDDYCLKKVYLNLNVEDNSIEKLLPVEDKEGSQEDDLDTALNDGSEVKIDSLRVDETKKISIPVKIVVTEMVLSEKQGYGRVKPLFSPFCTKLPKLKKEFGILRSAIIVGPWLLQWTECSLVIPRRLCGDMLFMICDCPATYRIKDLTLNEVATKLSQVIRKWNTTKNYSKVNNGNSLLGNSQHFVEECLDVLPVIPKKKGAFWDFLNEIKSCGWSDIVFVPSKQFVTHFKMKQKSLIFDSHRDLDNFIDTCAKTDEIALVMDFKSEWSLLRCFDRVFWLRHMKNPSIERFKSSKCFFNDPRKGKNWDWFK